MKLQGNTVDLTLTEFTDKKIAFKVDPALTMAVKFPEYECPVHGKIGRDTFGFQLLGEDMQTFCIRCIRDKLIEAGIPQVRRV